MTDQFDRSLPSPIAAVLSMRSAATDSVAIAGHLSDRQRRVAVPTGIEEAILGAVEAGGLRLIVVSGSAGDGKSFTIANLLSNAPNPWADYPERVIEDATHSERPDQEQVERLEEFFAPLVEGTQAMEGPPLMIAMNTGMVIRFFADLRRTSEEGWARLSGLRDVLMARLGVPHRPSASPSEELGSAILVANLDDRATTGGASSLFSGILAALDPQDVSGVMGGAERCATCRVRDFCWVRTNAELISTGTARAAIDELADRIAYERGRSIPPRALWDLAAVLATGGAEFLEPDPCDEIAKIASAERPEALAVLWRRVLPNGMFDEPSLRGLARHLRDQDPTFLASEDWHTRIATSGIEVAEDAKYLSRTLLRDVSGDGAQALRTITGGISTGEVPDALGAGWRSSVCRALARAAFLAGEIDAEAEDLSEFKALLAEYESGEFGDRVNDFEDMVGRALARSFGEDVRDETFFRTSEQADRDVAVQVRVELQSGVTHQVIDDPVSERNPTGSEVTGHRPLSIQLRIKTGADRSDETSVSYPLFKLLHDAERNVLPSATDLERFFSLRRAAAALGYQAARDRSQPILVSDRRTGRRVRFERQERRGSARFREQEVS